MCYILYQRYYIKIYFETLYCFKIYQLTLRFCLCINILAINFTCFTLEKNFFFSLEKNLNICIHLFFHLKLEKIEFYLFIEWRLQRYNKKRSFHMKRGKCFLPNW